MTRKKFAPDLGSANDPQAISLITRDGIVYEVADAWIDEIDADPMFADAVLDAFIDYNDGTIRPGVYQVTVCSKESMTTLSESRKFEVL